MLLVKTKIDKSPLGGMGLFADQFVPKGTVVWRYMPKFDILLSKKEIGQLSAPAQEQFYNYAYLDKKYQKYMLCSDDARFLNHSSKPNCDDSKDDVTIALCDVQKGEELLVNYRDFYGNLDDHPEALS